MKLEFEYLKEPLPMNEEVLKFLSKKGKHFFCIVREKKTEYNYKTYKDEVVITERVDTVTVAPNITVWGHDFFRTNAHKNEELIAYCVLEFPENVKIHI